MPAERSSNNILRGPISLVQACALRACLQKVVLQGCRASCATRESSPAAGQASAGAFLQMGSPEWRKKVDDLYASLSSEDGKRWARPDAPIIHDLHDEKAEPHVFFHNSNYRISRKYINIEKVKILKQESLECVRSTGHARYHKCQEIYKRFQAMVRVTSNVDRGPLARKRDVGFIYHTHKMRELQREAAELEIPFPFPKQVGA